MVYIGPYNSEPVTVALMHEYAESQGYKIFLLGIILTSFHPYRYKIIKLVSEFVVEYEKLWLSLLD